MSKMSKSESEYVTYSLTKQCKQCSMFRGPNSCITVEGNINPGGHCKFFESRKEAA